MQDAIPNPLPKPYTVRPGLIAYVIPDNDGRGGQTIRQFADRRKRTRGGPHMREKEPSYEPKDTQAAE